jgi:hypothetical protein
MSSNPNSTKKKKSDRQIRLTKSKAKQGGVWYYQFIYLECSFLPHLSNVYGQIIYTKGAILIMEHLYTSVGYIADSITFSKINASKFIDSRLISHKES